jgi:TonB dependent receptor/TonB-dependent Receptor Plug Domain/Gram-negative bacterial TonB protein C-terminal
MRADDGASIDRENECAATRTHDLDEGHRVGLRADVDLDLPPVVAQAREPDAEQREAFASGNDLRRSWQHGYGPEFRRDHQTVTLRHSRRLAETTEPVRPGPSRDACRDPSRDPARDPAHTLATPGGRLRCAARGRWSGALLVQLFALAARPLGAQSVPAVEPPSRVDADVLPYPAGASGGAKVLIEMVIERDGTVGEIRVVEGVEPFAGVARSGARSWRFLPARRGGESVRARIRMRVDFSPPSAPPLAVSSGVTPPEARPSTHDETPGTAAQGAAAVEEVTVLGVRPAPGRHQLSGADVRQMPGSFGDAFRAIEALPGVIPLVSGLPYFLVRGAPPGNTGFFIDGVRVPALFHLGVGAAVVHPGLIDRVDFYPGGYPARFGRFTGGILSGETVSPAPARHAEASLRLLDAGALVSSPLDGGRGNLLVSGRYGYPGPLLSLFAPDTGLAYWDYQAKAEWHVDDRDDVGAFVFGSYDSISQRDQATGQMVEVLGVQFHRVDLRWDRRASQTGRLRVALTLGYDRSAIGGGSSSGTSSRVEAALVGVRSEWSAHVAPGTDVRAGADAVVSPYRVRAPNSQTGDASSLVIGTDFLQTDVNLGLYGEAVWRALPRVEISPGLRMDAFTSRYPGHRALGVRNASALAKGTVDPRLGLRWDATSALALVAATGVVHQASNVPFPSPGLQFSQLAAGLQTALQLSAGAEVKLPADWTATADVFLHDYSGLVDYIESCPHGADTCTFDGRAVGLELLVRRSLGKQLTGWVSYTLSRAERDSFYQGASLRRLSEFDRTHVANLVLAADLGRRWRGGARLVTYSGLPYSTTTGTVGPPDARGPPFVRLDVRVEKRWNALGGSMALVFEWLNALLSKEALGTSCSEVFSGERLVPRCGPAEVGPITFPSVGVEAAW